MKWVLVILVCSNTGAWSNQCDLKEVAFYENKEDCLEAKRGFSFADKPACGLREKKQ